MAVTQDQIDQFEQTLLDRGGVVTATFNDQSVTFATYKDAMDYLAQLKRTASGAVRTRYVATDKGV